MTEQVNGVFFSVDGMSAIAINSVVKLRLAHWIPKSVGYKWTTDKEHWNVVATYAVGNETHSEILFSSTDKTECYNKYMEFVKVLGNKNV